MSRRISSANLAIERVQRVGVPDGIVVINHTDCDSVLTASIMSGRLEPLHQFGAAAIAADHTGEEDAIADLLQGLASLRDYEASLINLHRALSNRPMIAQAQDGVDSRRRKRELASNAVRRGRFVVEGALAFGVLEQSIDSVFFPPLLPSAAVILMLSPLPGIPDRWHARIRLGPAAPADFTLHNLSWASVDPGYAGRWNAGSNGRAGGTNMPPAEYANRLRRALTNVTAF